MRYSLCPAINRATLASWAAWIALACSPAAFVQSDEAIDYARDVQPILAGRCYACHGPDKQESGLRLDTLAGALEGGYSGAAVVPHDSSKSLLIEAITGSGDATRMPPEETGEPLAAAEIDLLRRWIDQGAIAPDDEHPRGEVRVVSDHWSFQPIVRPALPAVERDDWVRNPIDRFILARLETEGLLPSPGADRVTLIRRLSFDLLGLPPSIEEVDAFVLDSRPDAYERLVDRLLASPHYGERWGRHWLDAARYADSHGYTIDGPRSIWKYRDWVIDALNRDLPFDRFTIEQIAGDMLPEATTEQIVATGFHRNTLINQEGGTDPEQFRVESIVDRVETTGTVFLGLTIGCAQCHDHKFDPITQRDFYRMFAFLNNCDEPNIEVPTPEQAEQRAEIRREIAGLQKQVAALDQELDARVADWEASLDDAAREALAEEVREALALPVEDRTDEQQQQIRDAHRATSAERRELNDQIAALKKREPNIPTTMVLRERSEPRETHVMIRGDFLRLGKRVTPGVPAVLPQLPAEIDAPNRLHLAQWLVSPDNPLTARVTVNRLWQAYFGRGIVETENDFGTQGTPPTHPELLDWLAAEFIEGGWSLKAMHRLIVTSATYRQASLHRPDLDEVDPLGMLFARQRRLRLEAEIIRDAALASSGLLSTKIGGPSVFPPQPPGVMELAQVKREWKVSSGDDRYRRGMYTYFWRSTPHPFLKLFDAPEANGACTRRNRSNTPLQALTLLNDEAFVEAAAGLARRVLDEAPAADDRSRLHYAFRLCLARQPSRYETERLETLLATLRDEEDAPAGEGSLEPWHTVARVLLNLDEFITRE